MSDASYQPSYPLASLRQVARRITDGSHFSPTPQESGHLIANVKDMKSGKTDFSTCTRISRDAYRKLKATGCTITDGNVLLSKDGTVGRVVVYKQTEEIGVLSSICIIEPNDSLDPSYLGQVLRNEESVRQYENFMSGSALRRLVLRDIRSIQIPLPSLAQQRAIAKILDTLDDAIQKTEQLIAKLKQIKQGLLHDLLTRGIDENGQLRDPIAHPEQFKDSVLGKIPKEWRVVPLRQLIESLDAGVSVNAFDYPAASGQIGVLKTSAVSGGKFYPRENKAVLPQEISRARVRPEADSIIVSRMNTPELVGEHGYVDGFFGDLYLPDRLWLMKFKDKDLISARWLSFFLSTPPAKRHIALHATGTSGSMKNLPKDKFLDMLIPLPELAEQNLVAETLKSHEDRMILEGCHLQRLQSIKKGLMNDLLTGRVRAIQGESNETGKGVDQELPLL